MEEHYKQITTEKKRNKWTRKLIQQMWELQHQLWEHRNNIEHNEMTPAKQQQLEVRMARARDELQVGYADLQRQDRHLFAEPELVLSMTLSDLTLWLQEVGLARRAMDDVRIHKQEQVARLRAAMHAWLFSHNPRTLTTDARAAPIAEMLTAASHAE